MTPTTRPPLLRLLVLVIACAITAAACGDSDSDPTEGGATVNGETSQTEAAPGSDGDDRDDSDDDGTWPVEIEHRHGTTVIEGPAERVVSLGLRDIDAVLALGVVPVGIQPWFGDQPDAVWPWAHDRLEGASPQVLDGTQTDFEAIAGLRPDLIIAVDSGIDASEYELLSQIAPTVGPPADAAEFAVPWRQRTLMVAEALGQVDAAEALIADVEAAMEEARADHPELEGATALVGLASSDGQAYAYGSNDVRSQFLVELGLEIPEHIESQIPDGEFYVTLSPENLDQMDADVVLWVGAPASFESLLAQPVFPADVRAEGRELFVSYDPYGGAMSYASVLSLPFLVEGFVPELVLALDGDPATAGDLATP